LSALLWWTNALLFDVVVVVVVVQDLGHPIRKYVADYVTCAFESDGDAIDAVGLNT
jgi:hypothetical protein